MTRVFNMPRLYSGAMHATLPSKLVVCVQVSLTIHPNNAMVAGLAVALLLGGVANGVVPPLWQLEGTHPLLWLDYLSYTR